MARTGVMSRWKDITRVDTLGTPLTMHTQTPTPRHILIDKNLSSPRVQVLLREFQVRISQLQVTTALSNRRLTVDSRV